MIYLISAKASMSRMRNVHKGTNRWEDFQEEKNENGLPNQEENIKADNTSDPNPPSLNQRNPQFLSQQNFPKSNLVTSVNMAEKEEIKRIIAENKGTSNINTIL